MLLQNGALKALHKAVGPGMSGLDASVADPQLTAGLIKGALELAAPVREPPLDRPTCGLKEGDELLLQEACSMLGSSRRNDGGRSVGTGRIAGRELPDLPHALELADVESVQADQFSGVGDLHMPAPAAATQLPPSALGDQTLMGSKVSGNCSTSSMCSGVKLMISSLCDLTLSVLAYHYGNSSLSDGYEQRGI